MSGGGGLLLTNAVVLDAVSKFIKRDGIIDNLPAVANGLDDKVGWYRPAFAI